MSCRGRAAFARCAGLIPSAARGDRGGLRVIYYYFEIDRQIWLVTPYGKNEASDLSTAEKKALKTAIENETRQRAGRRSTRRTPHRR
jgi:hypothetical protein